MINLVGIEGGNEYDQNIVCDFQRTKEIVKESVLSGLDLSRSCVYCCHHFKCMCETTWLVQKMFPCSHQLLPVLTLFLSLLPL